MNREPFNLDDAWAWAQDLCATIAVLFGAPATIAARLLLRRKWRHDMLAWLGPLEALVRRLLLLKALDGPAPNCAPAPPARKANLVIAFTDRQQPDLPEDAAQWRVRFAVWPYGHMRSQSTAPKIDARRGGGIHFNAVPLARRLEALRRVLDNPDAALARLVRLLAQDRANGRDSAPAAFRPYRPPGGPVVTILTATQGEVELKLALNTS
jgi:hypothetical protein